MNPTLIRSLFTHRNALHLRRSLAVPRTHYFMTTPASQLQPSPTVLLSSPSSDIIEEQELDVELIPPQAISIGITQRAAEVRLSFHPESHSPTTQIPATSSSLNSRKQPGRGSPDSSRVWRMPRLPVQTGTRTPSKSRRLVSLLTSSRGN